MLGKFKSFTGGNGWLLPLQEAPSHTTVPKAAEQIVELKSCRRPDYELLSKELGNNYIVILHRWMKLISFKIMLPID